eukprot:2299469-Amphidinium_carterae.1
MPKLKAGRHSKPKSRGKRNNCGERASCQRAWNHEVTASNTCKVQTAVKLGRTACSQSVDTVTLDVCNTVPLPDTGFVGRLVASSSSNVSF